MSTNKDMLSTELWGIKFKNLNYDTNIIHRNNVFGNVIGDWSADKLVFKPESIKASVFTPYTSDINETFQ